MQDERRLAVLRAIVEDYVSTQEPVGSKALVERHGLGVSPATVRNDMAALEEEGLITQPHTSAGRVPTDKGYRLFVDRLTTIKPMSSAEKRAIATILDGAVDLDDVVQRSVRLLAQLTHQVALVQYPTLSRSTVRHVELVPLADTRVLAVLILSSGRVEQRLVELDSPLDEEMLAAVRHRVASAATGRVIAEATTALGDLTAPAAEATAQGRVIDVLVEAMSDHRSSKYMQLTGCSAKELSQLLHISPQSVGRALSLLSLPAEVQEQVASGEISPTAGATISRIKNTEVAKRVAAKAASTKAPISEVERTVRQKQRDPIKGASAAVHPVQDRAWCPRCDPRPSTWPGGDRSVKGRGSDG